ncbi:DUF1236 domain-containing protein, partial [Methyloceanibacter sp.]|uniref:DUF1236 domain-containing protein n=1 Tax=Methyloceanibacter sp. TaxID=1965321 RepID=UPI003D6C94CE
FASLAGAALIAGSALAVPAVFSPTGHLNVRSGPGFQYGVVAQMPANTRFPVTGCIQDYSWCSVVVGDVTGWASAPYLVTDAGGKPTNLQVSGAQLGIPIVVPTGVAAVVATPPVGAMVAVPPTVGVVEPVIPAPEVLSYVTQQVVQPVFVDGEVMVGATLPAAAPVYPIPASPYVYSYINGQRIVVEPGARRIVYVVR